MDCFTYIQNQEREQKIQNLNPLFTGKKAENFRPTCFFKAFYSGEEKWNVV